MGQDSSQLAGKSQSADGITIKQDPEEKENENLRELSNWEGSTAEEGLLRSSSMKGPERRKKQRKRRRSPSFSKLTYENAVDEVDRQTLGDKGLAANFSHRPMEADQVDSLGEIPSTLSRNPKQIQLEAKKRRLLAVVTAAAGNVNSPYSDVETDGPASGEFNNAEQVGKNKTDSDSLSKAVTKTAKELKNSRGSERTKAKKSYNSETTHLNADGVIGNSNLAPELYQGTQVPSINKILKSSESKSRLASTSSASRSDDDRPTTYLPSTPNDRYQILSQPSLEDPSPSPIADSQNVVGKRRGSLSEEGLVRRVNNRNTTREKRYRDQDLYETEEESTVSRDSYAISQSGPVKRKGARDTLISPQKTSKHIMATGTPAQRRSSTQGMELIDPALRDIGIQSDRQYQRIGVYRDAGTSGTIGKHKHLPIDDNIFEQTPSSEPLTKKRRKQPLKPKTPNASTRKPIDHEYREGSLDLDAPSKRVKKRKSNRKGAETHEPTAKGRFNDEELEIINNEMLKYRDMYDMTVFELNRIIQDTPGKLARLWDEICEVLPDRPRQAIVKVCRRKYHNFGVRGKWTKEEDQQLTETYERLPNKWKQIGQVLNRHHEDVRDRWRNYGVCGNNLKKESWTEDEENDLRSVVAECIQAVRELKAAENARNPGMTSDPRPEVELIDWQIVSAKLGHTRSRLQCLDKWNRMTRLENSDNDSKELELEPKSWRVKNANKDIKYMRREDYIELLVALRNSHAGGEGKVNWRKLGDLDLRTKWTCMARKVAWKKLRASIPGNEQMKFQDIVTMLLNNLPEDDAELEELLGGLRADVPQPTGELEGADCEVGTPLWSAIEEGEFSPQRRALSEAISSMSGAESDSNGRNIDPYLREIGENEIGQDDLEGRRQDHCNSSTEERFGNSNIIEDEDGYGGGHGDGKMTIADGESIDLDAPSRQKGSRNGASISFNAASIQGDQEDFYSSTHSGEEDVDMDIPARRPFVALRNESVDLGMQVGDESYSI